MTEKRANHRLRAVRLAVLVAMLAALAVPASAGAFIYWTNVPTNTIGRANLDGTGVDQSFITGATEPAGLAVDARYLFWANNDAIGRANLFGTDVDQGVITDSGSQFGVAVAGQYVYWTRSDAGAIARANFDGTGVNLTLITGANGPAAIAVDAQHIYWVNNGSNTIGRANLDGTGVDQSFITGANGARSGWPSTVSTSTGQTHAPIRSAARTSTAGRRPELHNRRQIPKGRRGRRPARLLGERRHRHDRPRQPRRQRRDQSFITGANAPFGVAVDSLPHASATTLACAPATVTPPATVSCTATLTDTGPFPGAPGPTAPTGTVAFSSSAGGAFTPAASCSLTATTAGQSVCELTYTPAATGIQTVTGAYSGDAVHTASNGATRLTILRPVPVLGPPGAPSDVRATAGDRQASVSFGVPAANGTIRGFTATATPGAAHASGTRSPITVRGLTDGRRYTFAVTATNETGTGPPSSPSNPVTPAGKPTISRGSLTGIAKRRPRLGFTIAAGTGAPALKTIAIGLPRGLTFSHHRRRLARDITAKDRTGRRQKITTRLSHGILTVTLKNAATRLQIAITAPAIRARTALANKAKHKRAGMLNIAVRRPTCATPQPEHAQAQSHLSPLLPRDRNSPPGLASKHSNLPNTGAAHACLPRP